MPFQKGCIPWSKGKKMSEEFRRKMSEVLKGNQRSKGHHHSEKTKKKIGKAHKGRKLSEEWKRKIGEAIKGKHHTEETKRKISEAQKGHIGYWTGGHHTEEAKRKLSEKRKGILNPNYGKHIHPSEETREKLRQARFNYIKKTFGIVYPTIGKHEKQLLDELEKELDYRIIRQYKVGAYHLDGYIPEINLAIEVDEKYHQNQTEKDIKREEFIKKKLGCQFLRIKDYN